MLPEASEDKGSLTSRYQEKIILLKHSSGNIEQK